MMKTIAEINEKIQKKEAVVMTAEIIIDLVKQKSTKKASKIIIQGNDMPTASFSSQPRAAEIANILKD